MKRAPWYLVAGAIAGFAGILGLHSKAAPAALAQQHGGSAADGRTGRQAGSAGAQGSARTAGPSVPSGTGGKARTQTGAMERYGYGELDVKVTVSGSRITNVTVPALHAPEQYSQQLAAQAIPMLKSQVMAADSARIHGISGATYTSEAYAYSLQSALDKLHFK